MKTFAGFTWEWIIEQCSYYCASYEQNYENDPYVPSATKVSLRRYYDQAKATLLIIPKLQQHPQLREWVAYKFMVGLIWYPSEGCEVGLFLNTESHQYEISVAGTGANKVQEKIKIVEFDDVADELYATLTRLDD